MTNLAIEIKEDDITLKNILKFRRKIGQCIGIILALVIIFSSTLAFHVAAENTAKEDFEISILDAQTRNDVITVSALDTAQGDVTLRVGLYIDSKDWPSDDYIDMATAQWIASDYNWIRFTNITDLTERSSEQQVITYSGGTYVSHYTPYCFVKTIESVRYGQMEMNRNLVITTTSNAFDSAFGAMIYQAGENLVTFSYNYYESAEDRDTDVAEGVTTRKKVRDCVCEVQYTEDGIPYIEYDYIQQDDFAVHTKHCELPGYDKSIAVGEAVPGVCDYFMMMYTGSSPTAFFGESSDEFPLITFDVVLEQGIPSGIYSVDLEPNRTVLAGRQSKSQTASSVNGITIIVDEDAPQSTAPEETTTTTPSTQTTVSTNTLPTATPSTSLTTTLPTETTQSETTNTVTTTYIPPDPFLSKKSMQLYIGESDEIQLYDADDGMVAWISEDPDLLQVDANEKTYAIVTGLSPGVVNLYAIVDGKALSCKVTILSDESLLLCGDVTLDQQITISDVVASLRAEIGAINLNYYAKQNADCNADGTHTMIDAAILMQFLLTYIDKLPSDLI